MKLLIYIFLMSLTYVLSDIIDGDEEKRILIKSYPKKVKPGFFQINNAGKYIKYKSLTTKKPYINTDPLNEYTAFPHVNLNAPDSPYFQFEKVNEDKPRVKKVLPDYIWHPRNKRSLDLKKGDIKKKALHQRTNLKPSPFKTFKAKGNVTQKLNAKQNNLGRSKNNKALRKRRPIKRQGMRKGKRLRHGKLRHGSLNRKLKYTKAQNKNQNRPRLRSKSDQKAMKVMKDRSSMNMTKSFHKGARRLIAGRDAMIEEYPYVVSIQKEREHWCAGALLNQRLVITTANCLWKGHRVSRMHIRAGSRHTDRGGQVANIQEVMKHPGWKIRKDPDNDVALVLLDRNIKFSHAVHGVDLPNRVMMPAFEDAWITSWGSERRDGVFESSRSNTLQVYHARIMDRQSCNNVTKRFGIAVNENFICLAQTGRRAPCTRDTGAPAVSDGVLWGLASWGIRKLCGTERFPAMFSYLGSESNLDFIVNATRFLMSDERFYPFLDRAPRMRTKPEAPVIDSDHF